MSEIRRAAVREDVYARGGDGYGVFEVGGGFAVFGDDRPLVFLHDDVAAAGDDHRLDGDRHAGPQLEVAAALFAGDEVGDAAGLLVHGSADAVADELADHAVPVDLLDVVL